MSDPTRERLAELRGEGAAKVECLWIERLPAAEGLAELAGREGPLFRLQEARFLIGEGRAEEARTVLEDLQALPEGLASLRRELLRDLEGEAEEGRERDREGPPVGIPSRTLAELHAKQGDVDGAIAVYEGLLRVDSGDEAARQRLRELRGRGGAPAPGTDLSEWLEGVRQWRRVLGV